MTSIDPAVSVEGATLPTEVKPQYTADDAARHPGNESGPVGRSPRERDREELALGLVGKFWLPVIAYAQVSPASFESFTEPGHAKTVYSLPVQPLGYGRTLLSAAMRTATTDEQARR